MADFTRSKNGVKTPEYAAWIGMRRRCYDSGHIKYADYGGRGIRICPEWEDFETFLTDMGPRPGETYSLNRLDNNGNYTKANCNWATAQEQADNKRIYSNNKTGISGISIRRFSTGKIRYYTASVWKGGKQYHLYKGSDFFEACCARKAAERITL